MNDKTNQDISSIIESIEKYKNENKNHIDICIFLEQKYLELKLSIEKDCNEKSELIEWSIWFAPRIIFESINDKEILKKVEHLNETLIDFQKMQSDRA